MSIPESIFKTLQIAEEYLTSAAILSGDEGDLPHVTRMVDRAWSILTGIRARLLAAAVVIESPDMVFSATLDAAVNALLFNKVDDSLAACRALVDLVANDEVAIYALPEAPR